MPIVKNINSSSTSVVGTCLQGVINCSYEEIVKSIGEPIDSFCGYKSDVEWKIEFSNGDVATIYNWKDGKNYNGPMGLPVEKIREWHIGGNDTRVTEWVKDLIHNSLPIFDEIRQQAQD